MRKWDALYSRRRLPVRILRERKGVQVYVGRWACRYSWSGLGRFSNGSRWSSGWHDWKAEDDALGY